MSDFISYVMERFFIVFFISLIKHVFFECDSEEVLKLGIRSLATIIALAVCYCGERAIRRRR